MFPSLPLSLALVGLTLEGLRAQLEWAASLGYRAVQLNAAAPDARPRDLGRSARRDLAAIIRRLEMTASGVDLFVPPAHLLSPEHADRAVAAMTSAIDFAAEMASLTQGPPVLSVELPAGDEARSVVATLATHADARGVRLADHAWPASWGLGEATGAGPIGVGLDPAAVLLVGASPAKEAARLGKRLFSARLSDISAAGRVEAGQGKLDLMTYSVSVITAGYSGFGVVDLRGIRDQANAAVRVKSALAMPGLAD